MPAWKPFGRTPNPLKRTRPSPLRLPRSVPMPKVAARLHELPVGALASDDVEFERQFARLLFVLSRGPVHGDALVGNHLYAMVVTEFVTHATRK
jgi:hypothetical protein